MYVDFLAGAGSVTMVVLFFLLKFVLWLILVCNNASRNLRSKVMIISVGLLCTAISCTIAWFWWRGRRARALLKGLPTYPSWPILGSLYKLYGGGEALFRVIDELSQISDESGLPFAMWIGPCPAVMFIHPDDVKVMTNSLIEKPYYYDFGRIWLGNGLVTAPACIWKQTIKSLGGAFTSSIVDGYQGVFDSQAQKLVTHLRGKVGSPPFDIMHDLTYITLEAICQTALGVTGVSEGIVTNDYYLAFTETMQLLLDRGLNPLLHLDAIYKLTPSYRKIKKCVAILQNVSKTIITRRTAEWNSKRKIGNRDPMESSSTKFKSYLDIILEMSSNEPTFTDEQIQAEVDTIIVGGQETIATNLFFILLMVGCHEQVQEKLYAELQEIFGDSNRPVGKEDLSRMKYCEAVIMETLRLYPSVPMVMRYADKDLQLKSCFVPKGTACAVNVLGAGRSTRAWGFDARSYRPERWLQSDLDSSSFYAFSYGRRACIGKKYAIALSKTIVANCLREFRFTSGAANMTLRIDLGLRPASGHLLQVYSRKPPDQNKS